MIMGATCVRSPSLGKLEAAVLKAAEGHRLLLLPRGQIAIHVDEHTTVLLFDEGREPIDELCRLGYLRSRDDDICAGPVFEITAEGQEAMQVEVLG
ncbi:MAG: hypothetical protein ABIT01_07365 [Thermoanaerobaculia bacterium]